MSDVVLECVPLSLSSSGIVKWVEITVSHYALYELPM